MENQYSSILSWVQENARDVHPFILGINGPQGCGKSTLANQLVLDLQETYGLRAVTLSIDDFYLTHDEQKRLAQLENPYLQQRGYPGTHDIDLGVRTLLALKNIVSCQAILCPVYDKSKFHGKGDRRPQTEWKRVEGPLDGVILEGWMLGFSSLPESLISDSSMKEINRCLAEYSRWTELLDGFIQLVPNNIYEVVEWRVAAEEKMKAQGHSGMSLEEVRAYILKFIPAYELYFPPLLEKPPLCSVPTG